VDDARAKLLSELAHGAPVALLATGSDGTIVYANEAAHLLLAYTDSAGLAGRNLYELVAPEDLDVRPLDARRVAGGAKPANERLMIRRDLSRVWVKTLTQQRPDGTLLFWLEDLSERHHLIEEVREAQRVETVGMVAAGLAHDLNNLLAVVVGHADLLRTRHGDELSQRALAAILEAGHRATQLTRKLLAFGRKQQLEPKVTNLNELIRKNLDLLSSLTGEHVAMVLELADDLHLVEVDVVQIEQALWNLATNACQVMEQGGRLRISTRNVELDSSALNTLVRPRSDPRFAVLSVEDTGPGMSEEVVKRVFDPFFTTRALGTGLGLSVVQGVVAQSGGLVRVRSRVGVGSTFELLLPKAHSPSQMSQRAYSDQVSVGRRLLLLAEPDEAARVWLTQALERRGFTVLSAADGATVLTKVIEQPLAPLAVVADLRLPGLATHELIARVRAVWPNTPAILLSDDPQEAAGQHSDPLLRKPVAAAVLAACLEQLLLEAD
jgi:PAS domain S-box-containing protein